MARKSNSVRMSGSMDAQEASRVTDAGQTILGPAGPAAGLRPAGLPHSSLDDFQSGDNDVDGLEHASNNNDDGFNASTEFEDFEFTISTPATIMETAVVETNIEHDDGTIARLRVEENSVPSPQCRTISKKHDYYSVEYDQVCKHFIAYIVLPKTEKRQAEVKYSLGKTDFVFA